MKAAGRVQPFGFDRDFSVVDGIMMNDAESLARRVGGLESELAQLKSEIGHREELARQQGFEAGLEQARNEQQQALLHALDAINACLENAGDALARERQRIMAEAADVALAAADHLAAVAIDRNAAVTVERVIGEVLDQVSAQTVVSIRVAPSLAGPLAERLAGTVPANGVQTTVAGDAAVPPGDARIEWSDGSLSLDAAQRRLAVVAALDGALG